MALDSSATTGIDYDQIVLDAKQATGDAVFFLAKSLAAEAALRLQGDRREVSALITVGSEITDVRAITIQFHDGAGANLNYRLCVPILVLADANGDAFVTTGGSTGIAVGTDGALLTLIAKKAFLAISEADGDLDLTWTDTGTETAFLAILLPSGKLLISSALTNT